MSRSRPTLLPTRRAQRSLPAWEKLAGRREALCLAARSERSPEEDLPPKAGTEPAGFNPSTVGLQIPDDDELKDDGPNRRKGVKQGSGKLRIWTSGACEGMSP